MTLRLLALGCAALSALLGMVVLVGLWLDNMSLAQVGTGDAVLPPIMALCLLLAAVVVLLLQRLNSQTHNLGVLSAERYRSLARATSSVVWRADATGRFVPDAAWQQYTGQGFAEQAGVGWLLAVHPDDVVEVKGLWLEAVLEQQPFQAACRLGQRDEAAPAHEAYRHVMLRAVPLRNELGVVVEWIGTATDDDERIKATQALRSAEEKYEKAFRLNPDAILLTGLDRPRVIEGNSGFARLTGYPLDHYKPGNSQVAARFWADIDEREAYLSQLLQVGRINNMRIRLRHREGAEVHCLVSSQIIEVEGERCVLSTIRDISLQVQAELEREQLQRALEDSNRKLERLARQDGLTGVSNRRAFDEALELELRRSARAGQDLTLVMLDVDCFKQFNDRYGHLAGDDCLRRLAMVLEAVFQRSGDFVARYGGEEFAVIMPDCDQHAAERAVALVQQKILALGIEHLDGPADGRVSVSAGMASLPSSDQASHAGGTAPATLIAAADQALYAAKAAGRNCLRSAASPYGSSSAPA